MLVSGRRRRFGLRCISSEFYARSTIRVARDLLGSILVRLLGCGSSKIKRISGIIVETEAYGFTNDPASHAYRGLTFRNSAISAVNAGCALPENSFNCPRLINLSAGAVHRGEGGWLGRKDSNLRIRDPKSRALPLGHAPPREFCYLTVRRGAVETPSVDETCAGRQGARSRRARATR